MPAIHCAPSENLEHVDVAFIYGEEHKIRMAAYGLMDGLSHKQRNIDLSADKHAHAFTDRLSRHFDFDSSKK